MLVIDLVLIIETSNDENATNKFTFVRNVMYFFIIFYLKIRKH